MDKKNILDRLDFNEKRIRETLNEIKILKDIIENEYPMTEVIKKLITSEKYRIKTAISMCENRKNTALFLGMSERSLYRKIINYNL